MKWFNLKKNKCPQCQNDLIKGYNSEKKIFNCSCGFKITTKRMAEIVSSQVNKDIDTFMQHDLSHINENT